MLFFVGFLLLFSYLFYGVRRSQLNTWSGHGTPGSRRVPKQDPRQQLEPSIFRDQIATDTEWSPWFGRNETGSACSHRLERSMASASGGYAFKPSFDTYFYASIPAILGVVFAATLISVIIYTKESIEPFLIIVFTCASLFLVALGGAYISWQKRFNASLNCATRSAKIRGQDVSLRELHALQLISDRFKSTIKRNGVILRYEINLIFSDSSRVGLICHQSQSALREDARTLATSLGVKLWDAIDYRDFKSIPSARHQQDRSGR